MLGSYPLGSSPLGARGPLELILGAAALTLASPSLNFAAELGALSALLSVNLSAALISSTSVVAISAVQPNIALGSVPSTRTRSNYVPNSWLDGAVVGPLSGVGRLPTGMTSKGGAGFTYEVTAIGTEDGVPYFDLRVFGTAPSASWPGVFIRSGSDSIPVKPGETWTTSFYLKQIAGTATQATILHFYSNAVSPWTWALGNGIGLLPTGTRTRLTSTLTAPATAVAMATWFDIGYVLAGNSIDTTVRFSGPQVEPGTVATPLIETHTGPVTIVEAMASSEVAVVGSFSASTSPATSVSAATVATTADLGATNFLPYSDLISGFSGISANGSAFTTAVVNEDGPNGRTQVRRVTVTAQGSGPRFGVTSGASVKRNVAYVGSISIRTADGQTRSVTPDLNNVNATPAWTVTPEWQRLSVSGTSSNDYRFMDLNLPVGVYDVVEVQIEFGTTPGTWIKTGASPVSSLQLDPIELASETGVTVTAQSSVALEPIDYTLEGLVVFTGDLSINLGAVSHTAIANVTAGAIFSQTATAATSSATATGAIKAGVGRRNLFDYSYLSGVNTSLGSANTVTFGQPDARGTNLATIISDTNTASRSPTSMNNSASFDAGTTNTIQIEVKKAASQTDTAGDAFPTIIRVYDGTNYGGLGFNAFTGGVANFYGGNTLACGSVDLGNGWWEVWFTVKMPVSFTPYLEIFPSHNPNAFNTGVITVGEFQIVKGASRQAFESVFSPAQGFPTEPVTLYSLTALAIAANASNTLQPIGRLIDADAVIAGAFTDTTDPVTPGTFTNVALWNTDLTQATWLKLGSAVTKDFATAPDGTNTAQRVILPAVGNAVHNNNNIPCVSGVSQTHSISVKNNGGSTSRINFFPSSAHFASTPDTHLIFDLDTGTTHSTHAYLRNVSIEATGDGWWHVQYTFTPTTDNASTNGFVYWASAGAMDFLVWRPQIVVGELAGPSIETFAAPVTVLAINSAEVQTDAVLVKPLNAAAISAQSAVAVAAQATKTLDGVNRLAVANVATTALLSSTADPAFALLEADVAVATQLAKVNGPTTVLSNGSVSTAVTFDDVSSPATSSAVGAVSTAVDLAKTSDAASLASATGVSINAQSVDNADPVAFVATSAAAIDATAVAALASIQGLIDADPIVDGKVSGNLAPISGTVAGGATPSASLSVALGAASLSAQTAASVSSLLNGSLAAVTASSTAAVAVDVASVDFTDPATISAIGTLSIDAQFIDVANLATSTSSGAVATVANLVTSPEPALSSSAVNLSIVAGLSGTAASATSLSAVQAAVSAVSNLALSAATILSATGAVVTAFVGRTLGSATFSSVGQSSILASLTKTLTSTQIVSSVRRILRRLIMTPRTLRSSVSPVKPLANYTP